MCPAGPGGMVLAFRLNANSNSRKGELRRNSRICRRGQRQRCRGAGPARTRPDSEAEHRRATLTITAIDQKSRSVTLRSVGDEDTFTAGPEVVRFNQLKVGDKINATPRTRRPSYFEVRARRAWPHLARWRLPSKVDHRWSDRGGADDERDGESAVNMTEPSTTVVSRPMVAR